MAPDDSWSGDDDGVDDWLWDLEDRYDLGAADETVPAHVGPAAAAEDPRLAQLRRYRRTKNGPEDDGGWDRGDEPTGQTAAVGGHFSGSAMDAEGPSHRRRWAVAAAIVVVVGVGAIAFIATRHGGHSGQPSVAVQSPASHGVLVGPQGVAVTQTPATSATSSTATTTAATIAGTPGATAPGVTASQGVNAVNLNAANPTTAATSAASTGSSRNTGTSGTTPHSTTPTTVPPPATTHPTTATTSPPPPTVATTAPPTQTATDTTEPHTSTTRSSPPPTTTPTPPVSFP